MKSDALKPTVSDIQEISPIQADSWLENCQFDRQRVINESRVRRIMHQMETKQYRHGTIVTFCVLGGARTLINGYHTLTAISRRRASYPLRVELIPVVNEQEIGTLYGTYDSQGSARTRTDINRAVGLDEQLGVFNLNVVTRASIAASWIKNGYSKYRTQTTMLEDVSGALDYRKELLYLTDLCVNKPKEVTTTLTSSPVLMVALPLMKKQSSAREFFAEVARNDGSPRAPARVLIDQIRRFRQNGVRRSTGHMGPAQPEDLAKVAVLCYIRWADKEQLHKVALPKQTVGELMATAIRKAR